MKILNPEFDLESFFNQIKNAKQRALLLDYDGTLAPFRVQRNQAFPYPGVREILNNIIVAQHSHVVIISGRWTKDLIPLLGLKRLPEIWGSHGIERLKSDGFYEMAELDEPSSYILNNAKKWITKVGLKEQCEQKPGALAIHWRGLSDMKTKEIREMIITNWSNRAQAAGLNLEEFDGGIEFRVTGRNKGHAVKSIFSEMAEDTVAAYLGDDLTDEDAFKAIKSRGIGILVRTEFRATAADLWLLPPKELLDFLSKWHKTCGGLI
ncbi:MAG: trehalose-phosphatase [bacterium]